MNIDIRALGDPTDLLQDLGRPESQVFGRRRLGVIPLATHLAVGGDGDAQLVRQVQKLEHGLQQVVAVGPASHNVQKMIDLRWRGPGLRSHQRRSQRLMDRRALWEPPLFRRVSRRGSWRPSTPT